MNSDDQMASIDLKTNIFNNVLNNLKIFEHVK